MTYRCYICGRKFSHSSKTRDHVIPKAIWKDAVPNDFMNLERSNVLPSCRDCNNHKSSSILFLPMSTDSWWPEEYGQQLLDLQIVFRYLLLEIVSKQNSLKLRSGYFNQWLRDYDLFRMRGVSKSDFDKFKIYTSTKYYMADENCRKAWWQ